MDNKQEEKISKLLSYILRHKPEEYNLTLDNQGWVIIHDLLESLAKDQQPITRQQLNYLVENNDKKRFTISDDGLRIRAAQGHSTKKVTIEYVPQQPPNTLFHGTATRFLDTIKQQGLLAGSRQYVHLSTDTETAHSVAIRHGQPVILKINSAEMYQQGYHFYLADNGVWLTEHVPVTYIND
ncbi:RNA 2'-phosphotransferase [Entomomonas sp. E2T0]|uniref:RNA 2'-phosphotransferase n=1 Tax=Entomomonas sp. E2T0 TaxID=2930213 RepID=UPI002228104D|nr:RNA 2'-phosphotransferase [Entomomonas sp. E2T0]UYZ85574.1 RNA 2'-phosphotransferase [Entomomonas sp. E2T0]